MRISDWSSDVCSSDLCPYQSLDRAPVDRMTINATAEIEQACKGSALLAGTDDFLDRGLPGALDRPQAIAHGARRSPLLGVLVGHRVRTSGGEGKSGAVRIGTGRGRRSKKRK